MKPKVSVIIPAYNCEKYITDCIKSVINQSYKNLEIIIVNDGSTDSTLEIMQKFSAEDSRIVLIDKENGGVGSARNAGLDIATGEYISFIDSDDYVTEDFIEKLLAAIKPEDAYVRCATNINGKITAISEQQNRLMIRQVVTDHLYSAECIKNIRFKAHRYSEDLIFNYELSLVNDNFSIIDDAMYFYRKNDDSISNNWEDHCEEIFEQMEELANIKAIELLDEDKKSRLEFAFIWYALLGNFRRACNSLSKEYIERSVLFVEKYFPNWRQNKYIKDYIWDMEKLDTLSEHNFEKALQLFATPSERKY